jgi:dipeptidyl aminopeptidase/acylaminoacyl peptidase
MVIAIAMIAVAVAAVAREKLRRASAPEATQSAAAGSCPGGLPCPGPSPAPSAAADLATLAQKPHLLFRSVELPPTADFGKVALAPLDPAAATRRVTSLQCARLHFAAGQGLCLGVSEADGSKFLLRTFGADLTPRWSRELGGLPSRARVSPDGRYGAVTVFVTGHSYSDASMSTQTLILDMAADRVVGDLEEFEVSRDGARFSAPDVNFWGVTFARDANRFYATLSSGGKTWLVEGDVAARKLRTLRENVECPSLSPDGKRLGFKKRMGGPGAWRLHVLDLTTLEDRQLAGEERPIDDQVEWLDDGHIVYKHGPDIWTLPVDGSAPARTFLPRASSPVVVRPPS